MTDEVKAQLESLAKKFCCSAETGSTPLLSSVNGRPEFLRQFDGEAVADRASSAHYEALDGWMLRSLNSVRKTGRCSKEMDEQHAEVIVILKVSGTLVTVMLPDESVEE